MIPPPSSLRDEIRRLERLREEDPGGLAFARLAEAYRSAGRYELALEVLEEGIREGPSHPAGHLVMARVHHDLEDRARERRALERALELDPENRVARRALAELDAVGELEGSAPHEDASGPSAGREERRSHGGVDADGKERRHASHSPEEREELLAQLHRVSREDWWEGNPDDWDRGGGPVEGEEGEDDGEGEVVTETMAHLYARQGLWEEAETVYRRLARSRPEEDRLARCLEQVEQREVPQAPPGRDPEKRPGRSEDGEPAARDTAGSRSLDTGGGVRAEVARPEAPREPVSEEDSGLTMRAQLRALLRGGGARPARDRSADDRRIARRIQERRDDKEGMDELLRRWRRAARKEDGQ